MTVDDPTEIFVILSDRREAIADSWYQALEPTGYPSAGPEDVRRHLDVLVEQFIILLQTEPVASHEAQAVGAALAQLHFVQPETLSRTLAILSHACYADLSTEQVAALQPRMTALLSELAAGFFEAARAMILMEQEAIRAALFIARRQAEAALRRTEEQLHRVVTNAPIVLFALDQDGIFTLCEGKGLAALGLQPGEVVGRSVFELYHDHAGILDSVRRALAGAMLRTTEEISGVIFETWYTPLYDQSGSRAGIIGVATDITERKRAEDERLSFEQLKADFVANVSHDLRTPLHHIKGYTALLLQRGEDLDAPTRLEFLQTIAGACDQLARLITDLLETARNTTGELRLQIETVELSRLVRSTVQRWQGISSHPFVALIPASVPPLAADPGRVEQVLDNLLKNVVRHTPEQTDAAVRVEVMADELVVSVIDHGPGVPSEHLPHLFERFYQVGAAPDGGHRGSGLGLFICKQIVEQHGGRIWAESTPGTGITVRFTLPRRAAAPSSGM